MTVERVRVSEIADEIGVPFPDLLFKFWRTCPKVVDGNLTVPATLLDLIRTEGRRVA